MKNLKTSFNKIHLAIVMCVFGVAFSSAQIIVRVPALCNVVVAGAGGTTGFGGKVGDGGIVVMPDPFDQASPAGDFTAGNIPVTIPATSITGWRLKGDLSFTTTTISGSAIQTGSSALTQNIESYNKSLRTPSEDGTLYSSSNPKWGRSKGTVRISYTSPPCNSFITFEVFKSYSNTTVVNGEPITWVPPIVGPDCVQPSSVYTYSVDQIASDNAGDAIGFDSYYWSGLPVGATNFYYSADKSSITFTTPAAVSQFTLACAYGRSNPFDGDGIYTSVPPTITYVKKTVDIIPVAPALTQTNITGLSSTSPTCLNTGVPSFSVAVTSPMVGFTYTWSYGGGSWTTAISGANQQIITLTNVDNNPGILTLKIKKTSIPTGCESVFNYVINRNFTTAIAIAGPTASPICLTRGNTYGFTLPSVAGTNALNNYTTWTLPTVPTTWGIANLNGPGSAVNITVPASTPAGLYTISAKSTLCPTGSISLVVYVRPATPTINASSPTCVIRNGGPAITTYSCNTVPGATDYTWNFPSGWVCNSGCNTTNPTVTPGGNATNAVAITVTANNTPLASCNSNPSASYTVNYSAVAPSTTTLPTCVNVGTPTSFSLTVANAPNPFYGSYSVSTTPTNIIDTYSTNATGQISVTTIAGTAAGTYSLIITHTGNCGANASNSYPLTITSNGGSLNPTFTTLAGCDTYSVNVRPPGSAIVWYVGGNAITANTTNIFIAPNGNSIQLCGPSSPGTLCAEFTLPGGCKTMSCVTPVGTHGQRHAQSNVKLEGITIYPNPNTGVFYIKVDAVKVSASATLNDITGKTIGTFPLKKGDNKIQKENLAKGTYTVLLTVDGKTESRKIIVE